MQRQILLATDLSARCDRAFDRAVLLAREWGARLTLATALEVVPDALVGYDFRPRWRGYDSEMADAESQIHADLQGKDIDVDVVIRRANASDLLVEIARETPYDLIVTGIARNAGFARAILGATVEALLRARVGPVLVVKRRVRNAYRSVLVGTDFSEGSRAALRSVSALFPQTEVTVLHAYDPAPRGFDSTQESDAAAYGHAMDACARYVAEALPVSPGRIRCVAEAGFAETLLNQYAIDKKIDLMSVGTHGRNLLLDLLFGSTCRSLVLSSPCDLLLVSGQPNESPDHQRPTAGE